MSKLCVFAALILALVHSVASSQPFNGIVEQRIIHVPQQSLFGLSNGIRNAPTPEEETFGFPARDLISLTAEDIVSKVKSAGSEVDETNLTTYFRANAVRSEVTMPPTKGSGKIINIVRHDKRLVWLLMPDQKKYIVTSFEQMENLMQGAQEMGRQFLSQGVSEADTGGIVFEKTGQKKSLIGLACEIYTASRPGELYEVWLTQEHPSLRTSLEKLSANLPLGPAASLVGEVVNHGNWKQLPGVPMLVKHISQGQGMFILQTTSIRSQMAESTLFEPPKDYTETDIMQLIQRFMPQGK